MTIGSEVAGAFEALEARIKTVLPAEYQDSYEDVKPVSMGSAGLKYGDDGKVAWDEIWGSFCDLAMAGGPPHKGMLLEPASLAEIEAQPERYREVVEEICRGIRMVTELPAEASPVLGWVRVDCDSLGMAGWLVRAIVMENVSAHWEGTMLDLPAGPGYRIEKEVKNVITSIAKTCHYWSDHMWYKQHLEIANLFARMSAESPLVQPAFNSDATIRQKLADAILNITGLPASKHVYRTGWLGLECPDVRSAIWMMRAMVVSNVLARRERTVLFVPVNAEHDVDTVASVVAQIHDFAKAKGVL
jgi:sirohydrochlorin cobaltochelatase